jgi:putative membrane protein
MYLTEDQTRRLDNRIRELERHTGVELVAAMVGKCDNYPEIPWKAFALGVALSALVWPSLIGLHSDPMTGALPLLTVTGILAAGALMALLTALWPAWARCFLDRPRAEAEMRQYAQALLLELDMAALPGRNGLMLLIGLFERQLVVLPDRGVAGRLPADALEAVVATMRPLLQSGDGFHALTRGVEELEARLRAAGFLSRERGADLFPETLIQRKGAPDD